MPLNTRCPYRNPVNKGVLPHVPTDEELKKLPSKGPTGQGDHVFGGVIEAIGTALEKIFGGGSNWEERMNSFSHPLTAVWTNMKQTDYGHSGIKQPVVYATKGGPEEVDRHATVFGAYSERLQWHLCEIVCTGLISDVEVRSIGSGPGEMISGWKHNVLRSFDDLMNNLVDRTAFEFYIKNPTDYRTTNSESKHDPMSLESAIIYVGTSAEAPGSPRLREILNEYMNLRAKVNQLVVKLEARIRPGYSPHQIRVRGNQNGASWNGTEWDFWQNV